MARRRIQGITIELDGETKGLDKALQSVNKRSRDLQSELRDVDRLLKFNPDNVELLEQKQRLLTEQVENTSDKLDQLRRAEKQVQQQFKRGEIKEEQYRAFQRELVQTESRLESFQNELRQTQTRADSLGKRLKEAGKQARDFGREAAKGFGAAGAAGATAVGGLVTGMQEYNQDLARLRTNATMAGRDLGLVEDAFMKIVAVTGEADSAVETVSNLLASGFTDNQLAQVIDQINGAAIRFSDTLKTEGIADGIQETFATGEAVGPFAELLERSGIELEEFNKKLQAAQKEGEGTNFIMQTLAEQGFGQVYEKYQELNPEVQRNAEANANLQKALADLAIVLTPLVVQVTDIITKLANWAAENPRLAQTIATVGGVLATIIGIFAALMPIVSVLTNLWPVLGAAIGAISTPVLVVIGVITALIAIGIALWKNWETVKENATRIWNAITDDIKDFVSATRANIGEVWDWIRNTFKNALDFLKALVTGDFEGMYEAIKNQMENTKETIKNIWDNVKEFLDNIDLFEVGKDIIQGLINGIKNMAGNLVDSAKGVVNDAIEGAKNLLGIASPSKVFEEIGEDTTRGFAIGIGNRLYEVSRQANALASAAIQNARNSGSLSVSSTQSGNQGVNNLNFTRMFEGAIFNVRQEQDIERIAKQLNDYIRMGARKGGVVF